MEVSVRFVDEPAGIRTRARVEERVRSALGTVSSHIRDVAVVLSDVNGPRGGVDKRCLLRVRLAAGGPEVVTQALAEAPVLAAANAARRARTSAFRRLRRRFGRAA